MYYMILITAILHFCLNQDQNLYNILIAKRSILNFAEIQIPGFQVFNDLGASLNGQ